MENIFICPICRGALSLRGNVMRCERGHSYDIARQGYVNLLRSNSPSSRRHGDDALMVTSRRAFLEKGYYDTLLSALCDTACEYRKSENDNKNESEVTLADIGCGEGYFTRGVVRALAERGKSCRACGIDISKRAVRAAAQNKDISFAVASANDLPFADCSIDILQNVFAPQDEGEFLRVTKKGGLVIRAVPGARHLFELKEAVYDRPYLNEESPAVLPGFKKTSECEVQSTLCLSDKEDIFALFTMTPYYYKTSRADQEKLARLTRLETTLDFRVVVFEKE